MASYSLFLLVVVSHVTAHTLHITPDGDTNSSNTYTLSYCLNYAEKCFTSDTQLFLLSGFYDLKRDLILRDLKNFSIIGNYSTLQCTNSSVGIAVINVTNIVVQGIEIIQCYSTFLANTYKNHTYVKIPTFKGNAAIHLHYCASIIIENVSIIVESGTNGLAIINAMV